MPCIWRISTKYLGDELIKNKIWDACCRRFEYIQYLAIYPQTWFSVTDLDLLHRQFVPSMSSLICWLVADHSCRGGLTWIGRFTVFVGGNWQLVDISTLHYQIISCILHLAILRGKQTGIVSVRSFHSFHNILAIMAAIYIGEGIIAVGCLFCPANGFLRFRSDCPKSSNGSIKVA